MDSKNPECAKRDHDTGRVPGVAGATLMPHSWWGLWFNRLGHSLIHAFSTSIGCQLQTLLIDIIYLKDERKRTHAVSPKSSSPHAKLQNSILASTVGGSSPSACPFSKLPSRHMSRNPDSNEAVRWDARGAGSILTCWVLQRL